MKFISSLFTLVLLAAALCFALKNNQSTVVSLWPFGIEVEAPLYILTLGTLFFGIVIGATFGWAMHLPHRVETRRLRRAVEDLRGRIDEIQTAAEPRSEQSRGLIARFRGRHRIWHKRV
jgi:uncharacterized integral membrane protein